MLEQPIDDLVDVRALAPDRSFPDLEELGRRHAWDAFDLSDLQSRLESTELLGDAEFAAHGLDDEAVTALRHWSRAWATDIAERLLEAESRGMWSKPDPTVLEALRQVFLETEGDLEGED